MRSALDKQDTIFKSLFMMVAFRLFDMDLGFMQKFFSMYNFQEILKVPTIFFLTHIVEI